MRPRESRQAIYGSFGKSCRMNGEIMKTKQVVHLNKNDVVVLTNQTSGQRNEYKVHGVEISEEYPELPVRVYFATPDPVNKKSTSVVGYRWRDNVEIV